MVDTTLARGETLPAVLAARARAASDGRLALDVCAGVVAALGIAAWHPVGWVIPFNVAICLTMFGAWGIAEREMAERRDEAASRVVHLFRFMKGFALVVGTLAVIFTAFAILGMTLGTWIS